MSFMYGPEYFKVKFPPPLAHKFPHYNLYIYHDEHTPNKKYLSQQGVPVVFVPGSGGSYRQVRSLASTSNQLFPSSPFDFFALDFNEEPSGLYGGILSQQAAFLQECIRQIGAMYGAHQSTRVILVGHSMGGIVARAVFSQPGFLPSSVHSIFTFSTPNNGPVILLDPHMERFYSQVNHLWQVQRNLSLSQIPFVSLAGGIRDLMVFTHLTPLFNLTDYFSVTSSMPHVWTSNDHLSIVWCRQLMEVTANLLHDFLDPSTNQLTTDHKVMKEVLDYHLIQANAGPRLPKHPAPGILPFPQATEFILEEELSWKYAAQKVLKVVCLLIPLAEAEKAVIVASGIDRSDWLFACRSGETPHCTEGVNLSPQTGVSPGLGSGSYRVAHLSMSPLLRQEHTHLAVLLSPTTSSKVKVMGDRYRPQLRHRLLQVPGPWRFLVNLLQPLPLLSSPVSEGALYYNLTLLGVSSPWHAHTLLLHTRLCRSKVQGEAMVRIYIPWTKQSYYYPSRSKNGYVSHIPLKLQVPLPPGSTRGVQVHVYLDPECGYQLSIGPSVTGMFQQLIRFYWTLVPSQVVALLLVVLSGQLLHLHMEGTCPSSFKALQSFPSMLTLAILPLILYLLNMNLGLPPSSDHVLYSRGLYFIALRFLLYYASYGFMILFIGLLTTLLLLLGKVVHRILPALTPLSPRVHLALVATAGTVLVVVALTVAGSLAICLAALVHLAYVVAIVEESRVRESRRGPDGHNTRWQLHLSISGLWVWLVVCTAPSLYVWGWSGGFVLHSDPHRAAATVAVVAAACLWYRPPPLARQHLRLVAYLVHGVAILCSIYGPTAPHLLLYFICVALSLLAAQQLVNLLRPQSHHKCH